VVSALRGHALAHAAKCLILLVKIGKKQTCYVLAVVPSDARLDLAADPALLDCDELYFNAGRLDRSVALASRDYLRLAGPRIARIIAT
jgi:Ala-tRNA(Pro) deacylase